MGPKAHGQCPTVVRDFRESFEPGVEHDVAGAPVGRQATLG
jgi:hypothetical protein